MFYEWLENNLIEAQSLKCTLFPDINDRKAWENINPKIKSEYLNMAEEYKDFSWPILTASNYYNFFRTKSRMDYENPYFDRRIAMRVLVIAQCILGKEDDTYKDTILNGIVAICEESYWGLSAHNNKPVGDNPNGLILRLPNRLHPIVDLYAAETGSMMSWLMYLLKDIFGEVSDELWQRVRYEVKSRLLEPFMTENGYWWMGFTGMRVNNWCPWISSNLISCLLICEDNTDFIKKFLEKDFRCLDNYLKSLPDDGGCDEGAGYWFAAGGALFQCLYQLYLASDGRINFYNEPMIKKIGHYIACAHIDKYYYVNFADCSHKMKASGKYISLFGKYINDSALLSIGDSQYRDFIKTGSLRNEVTCETRNFIRGDLEKMFEVMPEAGKDAVHDFDAYLPKMQTVQMRSCQNSADGLIVAAKFGHNAESHNHNDVGSFIAYANGHPAFIDPGVETYSAKTFSADRYKLWTMQSVWHNLMTVNGCMQHDGGMFRANNSSFTADNGISCYSADIEKTYEKESHLNKLHRSVTLDRAAKKAVITDTYSFDKNDNTVDVHFITLYKPEIGNGVMKLSVSDDTVVCLSYDSTICKAECEERRIEDPKLLNEWGEKIYRTTFKTKCGKSLETVFTIAIK